MTISRLLVLQVLLLAGMSAVHLIPREQQIRPSRVNMNLPATFGEWDGKPAAVSAREREGLAKDTQFARRLYSDSFGDNVFVSIVLSGQDLDNSIHRPERCLPAQGWTLVDSRTVEVPVPGAPGGFLPVTRLHNVRQSVGNDGRILSIYNIDYYWFVGASDVTASHFEREYLDMKERVLHGYNQHWAYITVSSLITERLQRFGKDEEQTDNMLQKIIADLYPVIVPAQNKM